MNVAEISNEELKSLTFVLRDEEQRAYLNQDGLSQLIAGRRILNRLREAREKARLGAIQNLARYKFSNFGYHAARWVTLNKIIGDKEPNPFRPLVELARTIRKNP